MQLFIESRFAPGAYAPSIVLPHIYNPLFFERPARLSYPDNTLLPPIERLPRLHEIPIPRTLLSPHEADVPLTKLYLVRCLPSVLPLRARYIIMEYSPPLGTNTRRHWPPYSFQ